MHSWPLLVHWCGNCHYNTPVSYSPDASTQQHSCAHCGATSTGADVVSRSTADMSNDTGADINQHDELAQLFAQGMQLSSPAQLQQAARSPAQPAVDIQKSEKLQDVPVHYVSAHYTGTAHIRPDAVSEPSRSPPPPYHESLMPEAMAEILRQHAVDPSALLPNQIQLFQNADNEQRLRLLQLWRITPPSYPLEDQLSTSYMATTVEREEALAAARYEQKLQHTYASAVEEHMLDTHIVEPMSAIREPGEPAFPPSARMRAASIASSRPTTHHGEAEPYIVNVYTADQSAKSMDPVYAASPGIWQVPSFSHNSDSMENQYGMYEQIRNHADWERMNERIARERLAASRQATMDDDMVL